ncbi:MAG: glycosyltransferase family 4 protein [Terracoccus sp.]
MRVLLVVGRATGGIGAHVDGLRHDLRVAGHEVVVVTAPATAAAFGWDDAELSWPVHAGAAAARGPLDWHRVMRLAGSVDVVHAHGHQAAVVAAVAVARARPRPRLVVSLHNDLPPRLRTGPASRLVGWALRRADLVTGASDDLVALAADLGARTTELAGVASPWVASLLADSVPTLQERRRRAERLLEDAGLPAATGPLVLTVSRIAPQKDLMTLVQAVRRSRSGATWVVVGGGDEQLRADVEEAAHGIPLHLLGPRDDIGAWLGAANAFVLTSRWEARALVVQEAMAAGLPVVATRTGGLPGLLGDAGHLVEVGDAPGVADAVDSLLSDSQQWQRRSSAGRELARGWASPEVEARRWVDRYVAALEK